jgi:hypothetical protein
MEASEVGFSENFPAMTITRGTNCGLSELGDRWRLGSITTDSPRHRRPIVHLFAVR